MKKIIFTSLSLFIYLVCSAQQPAADTVVVELAKSSKLMLTIHDRDDIELLRHYDFQGLFDDILSQLEDDTDTELDEDDQEIEFEFDEADVDINVDQDDEDEDEYENDEYGDADEIDIDDDEDTENWGDRISGNLDLGLGNYLSSSGFPDEEGAQYAVKPWGSWYLALGTIYHMRVNEAFKVEWGLGFSMYNFKFEDERTLLTENATGVEFTRDTRDFVFLKSKLSVNYINFSVLPMIEFGHFMEDDDGNWKGHRRNFRIGAGVYGGYRLHSFTKQKYEVDGDVEKEKNKDNFYLNNLRYGLRFQFGIRDVDFFFNYDLNSLFAEDRGPELNAYSFGIIF